jgi:hypothetical protein
MLDMLISEKVHFKNELDSMIKREKDSVVSATDLKDDSKAKADKQRLDEVQAERPRRLALDAFVSGIEAIEIELKTKDFTDLPGLGKGLDSYFYVGYDRNSLDARVNTELAALKQWLSTHIKK